MHFVKYNDEAQFPSRGTSCSAGYDLFSLEGGVIPSGSHLIVGTGIGWVDTSPDDVAIIKPRSGLAAKYGIDVLAGVIDSDYRNEWKVILINHGPQPFVFDAGDRIAQVVLTKFLCSSYDRVRSIDRVGGLGSTGK